MVIKNYKYTLFSFFILTIIVFNSCKKTKIVETNIMFLGHKGHGDNEFNKVFIENTMPGVKDALSTLDGVEQDVQMSKDGTIWIFHNVNVMGLSCSGSGQDTIPKMFDAAIEKIKICHEGKQDRLYKLAKLIDFWNASAGFYISIDMKTTNKASIYKFWGSRDAYLVKFAENLNKLFTSFNHPGRVLIETDTRTFYQALQNYTNTKKIIPFFISELPMDQKISTALTYGFKGLSCDFTDPTVTKESIASSPSWLIS